MAKPREDERAGKRFMDIEESCIDTCRNDKENSGYIQCPPLGIPLTLPHSHTSVPGLYPNPLMGSAHQQVFLTPSHHNSLYTTSPPSPPIKCFQESPFKERLFTLRVVDDSNYTVFFFCLYCLKGAWILVCSESVLVILESGQAALKFCQRVLFRLKLKTFSTIENSQYSGWQVHPHDASQVFNIGNSLS